MDRAIFAHSLAEMRGIFIGIMTNDDFNKLLGIKVEYHDSREDQLRVVESMREAEKMIEAKEREINALQDLKRFYQAMMFPSAK